MIIRVQAIIQPSSIVQNISDLVEILAK